MGESPRASDNWQAIHSQVVYQGWLTVVQDRLLKPTGDEMDYTYIRTAKVGAAVLAFADRNQVVLTRQYRHPMAGVILDLPAGASKASESPEETALRELREKTGYRARDLRLLGQFRAAPGLFSTTIHVFVGKSLEAGTPEPDEGELIDVVLMDWEELLARVLAGEPMDGALAYAVLVCHARYPHGPV